MKIRAVHIFLLLSSLFLLFSFSIYLQPLTDKDKISDKMSAGHLVWQKYNCQSCHQLYGLGGYLGPDLTNLFVDSVIGLQKLRAITKTGVKQMPSFSISDKELEEMTEFFKYVHKTGNADPRNFEVSTSGMIHAKRK